MRKLFIIGIGAGNPDYMTIQAIKALNQVDVIFIPDKGAEKRELRRLREEICERFIETKTYRVKEFEVPRRDTPDPDYLATVEAWHARIEASYRALLSEHMSEEERGAFLVWGDPSLYDSALRIVQSLQAKGFELEYEVIPGITSVQALAAGHRIPLNPLGGPLTITTGRRLREALPNNLGSVVVMLDGELAFKSAEAEGLDIFWGAYLGTDDEILIAGALPEVSDSIETVRREAREKKGWIMDTYLLRKRERD